MKRMISVFYLVGGYDPHEDAREVISFPVGEGGYDLSNRKDFDEFIERLTTWYDLRVAPRLEDS